MLRALKERELAAWRRRAVDRAQDSARGHGAADDARIRADVQRAVGRQKLLRHHCEGRPDGNSESAFQYERVGRALPQLHENLAKGRRPDLAVLVLRTGRVADDEIRHRFLAVDTTQAIGTARIAARLRWVSQPATGMPIADAEPVA